MKKERVLGSKLGWFSDRLIETGWLTAVAILPMLFNTYVAQDFIMHRVCMLRSIALIIVLAWGVKTLEEWKAGTGSGIARQMRAFLQRPLVLPAVMLAAAYILSTVLSVWPRGSFWGSYQRQQGTYTTLCHLALFLLVLQTLRTRAQLERVTTLIIVGSLPVCLYALVQYNPLAWEGWQDTFGGRVSSSLGNPIFLGAYVIMVVPLTLSKVIRSAERIPGSDGDGVNRWVSVVLYSLILLVQCLSVVLTQSRGPFLAFLVSLFLFALLYLVLRGRRWQGIAVISMALAAGLFLVALNLPNTPLDALKDLPYVGRLGTIANTRTVQMRALIWEGAVRMSAATPLRTLFGHGPDTTRHVFYPYLSPELVEFQGPGVTADRLHNEILDTWATTGLMGVAAQLLLFGSIFIGGFQWLGLISTRRRRVALGGMMAGGGILGAVIPWLADGTLRFSGIGVSLGLVLALFVYLGFLLIGDQTRGGIRPILRAEGEHDTLSTDLLLVALLSAIVAHFVEIQTGVSITATRTQFWVYAALMGVIGLAVRGDRALNSEPGERRGAKPSQASLLAGSLLTGLLLMTMAFGLIRHDFDLGTDAFIVLLLVSVWLLAGMVLIFGSGNKPEESETRSWSSRLFIYSITSLGCLLAFAPFHLANLRPFLAPATLAPTYYAFVLLVMFAAAASLLMGKPLPRRFAQKHWWVYPILVLVIGAILIRTNLNLVRADTYAESGREYGIRGRWDRSAQLYQRAVELAPGQDRYHLLLGQAYLELAQLEPDIRARALEKALEALEAARQISPLDPDHYANLGHLYSAWADLSDEPEKNVERLTQALSYYGQAGKMAPAAHGQILTGPTMETHAALAQSYVQLGMVDRAIAELEAAAELGSPEDRSQLMEMISQLRDQAP